MLWVWLIALVVFIALEVATAALVSIWFVGGALVALVAAVIGAGFWTQFILFAVVSLGIMIIARPLAAKRMKSSLQPTNADRVLGMTGIVTGEIDNIRAVGEVKVAGTVWSARSADGESISVGEEVKPVRIEGVKLIVSRIHEV